MVPRDLPRGEIPDAAEPPLGCPFHPRCPEAVADVRLGVPRPADAPRGPTGPRPGTAYDEETTVLGDLDHLDTPSITATVGRGGSEPVRAILDGIRAEDPDEPMWSGVEDLEPEGSGLRVRFRAAESPALRRAGEVDVACVLYPDEPGD